MKEKWAILGLKVEEWIEQGLLWALRYFSHSTCLLLHTSDLTLLRDSITSLSQKSCFAGMRTKTGSTASDGHLPGEVGLPPSPGSLGPVERNSLGPKLSYMDYWTSTNSDKVTFLPFNVWEIVHLWTGWILQILVHLHSLLNLQDRIWKIEQFKFHHNRQRNLQVQTVGSEQAWQLVIYIITWTLSGLQFLWE